MAQKVTYETPKGKTFEFQYPVLTVTETPITSAAGDFTASVRKIFTIRSLITCESRDTEKVLLEWREGLTIVGGKLVIEWGTNQPDTVIDPKDDLEHGPFPSGLSIDRIHGSRAFQISWQLSTLQFPTKAGYTGDEGKWVGMVYTVRTSLDANFFATRSISGALTLNRSHASVAKYGADAFRNTVTKYFELPEKANGYWQRVSLDFSYDNTKRVLTFGIVDKQLYTWLPKGALQGDVEVTTTQEILGRGRYSVRGWFEGSSKQKRGDMFDVSQEILNLFYSRVIKEIAKEQGKDFLLKREFETYTTRLSSNRIDFATEFFIQGSLPGAIVETVDYTVGKVINWLSYLTKHKCVKPDDPGAYGTSHFTGSSKKLEGIAPIINIDFASKKAKAETISGGTTPSDRPDALRTGRQKPQFFLNFRQSFQYRFQSNVVFFEPYDAKYNPLVTSRSQPTVYLTVLGEASTLDPPRVPLPPYKLKDSTYKGGETRSTGAGPEAILVDMDLSPTTITPEGVYKLEWNYTLRLTNIALGSKYFPTTVLAWPKNPMAPDVKMKPFKLSDDKGQSWT
jgi:hypothetical protein